MNFGKSSYSQFGNAIPSGPQRKSTCSPACLATDENTQKFWFQVLYDYADTLLVVFIWQIIGESLQNYEKWHLDA